MRCLVTAGNTREKIDRVRDWGNIFTGRTGLAIARALTTIGAVDLLTSNQQHLDELEKEGGGIEAHGFSSHGMLMGELAGLMSSVKYDAVFYDGRSGGLSAQWRVGDRRAHRCRKCSRANVEGEAAVWREDQQRALGDRGGREHTAKIVDMFRGQWGYQGLLVKFKLEVDFEKMN